MLSAPSGPTLRRAGYILLALYFIAGAIYSIALPPVGRFPDELQYLALTNHLLHGPGFSLDGVHLTAFRPPGYSFFLATVGNSVFAARILQYGMLAGIILLLARLTTSGGREPAVLPAATVVMIYPLFFYTGSTLYPQTLAGFLFVLVLALLLQRPRGWLMYGVIGLIYGFLILVVPTFLLTLFILLAAAWWLGLLRLRDGIVFTAAAAVVVLAWTGRNYVEFQQFVPVASYSGEQLLIGNNETTLPYGGSGNVNITSYGQVAQDLHLDEFQADKFYRKAALTWMRENPGRAFVLYLEKTANFFNVYNAYAPESKAEVSPWKQAVVGLTYAILLALLIWRLIETRRFPLENWEKLFLVIYVLSAFAQAIFFTRIRLRLPFDFLIVALIAAHLQRHLVLWSARRTAAKAS